MLFCSVFVLGMIPLILFFLIRFINDNNILIKFRVHNVSVSAFNIISSKITGEWDCQLFVRNPNKFNVSHSSFTSSMSYKYIYEDVVQKSIPPFSLPKKSEMLMNITFVTRDVNFSSKDEVLRRLEAEMNNSSGEFFTVF